MEISPSLAQTDIEDLFSHIKEEMECTIIRFYPIKIIQREMRVIKLKLRKAVKRGNAHSVSIIIHRLQQHRAQLEERSSDFHEAQRQMDDAYEEYRVLWIAMGALTYEFNASSEICSRQTLIQAAVDLILTPEIQDEILREFTEELSDGTIIRPLPVQIEEYSAAAIAYLQQKNGDE